MISNRRLEFSAGLALLASCSACAQLKSEGNLAEQQEALGVANGQWTQVVAKLTSGRQATDLALLTDGRVLATTNTSTAPQEFYVLTPDSNGSYVNGHWTDAGGAPFYTDANPSFVFQDGRYMLCIGEHSDSADLGQHLCTIYDPGSNNSWSDPFTAPGRINDTSSTNLADGRAFLMVYGTVLDDNGNNVAQAQIYDPKTGSWTRTAQTAPFRSNEGGSIILQDGSVFTGYDTFQRYRPDTDTWVQAPSPLDSLLSATHGSGAAYEIGPMVMLPGGSILQFGGNSKNGIYTPPTNPNDPGTWARAADTPPLQSDQTTPQNHGDTPACVEVTGNVLTVTSTDSNGFGTGTPSFWEYQTAGNVWAPLPDPPGGAFNVSAFRLRMLPLPNGQVLVSGYHDGTMWVWTPTDAVNPAWQATITSLLAVFGNFSVQGVGLNGVSTGAEYGDDARMPSTFPIPRVSDFDQTTHTYGRGHGFDWMAPGITHAGSFQFTIPTPLAPGVYTLETSTNGILSRSFNFTEQAVDMGPAVVAALLF